MLMSKHRIMAAGVLGGSLLFTAACGGGTDTANNGNNTTSPSASSSSSSTSSDSMNTMMIGSGCADYAKANPSGPGSVEGMTQDPVGTAASNNPLLKQLTAAVSGQLNPQVNLVDTLNDTNKQYTVFAPVDDAFAKVDPATLNSLKTDSNALTNVLTYHVLDEKIEPSDIVGDHKTLQGEDLKVEKSGDTYTVNGNATIVCGGVQTANATVYLIDSVLTPPAADSGAMMTPGSSDSTGDAMMK